MNELTKNYVRESLEPQIGLYVVKINKILSDKSSETGNRKAVKIWADQIKNLISFAEV